MVPEIAIREATLQDARSLAQFAIKNKEFLRPFEPARTPDYYTVEHFQSKLLRSEKAAPNLRTSVFWLIFVADELIGNISLSNVIRGPFQSGNVGYAVDQNWNGRGVATAAVAYVIKESFTHLELHRLEAGTLTDNFRSQRVLEKNKFTRIGVSPKYLEINGKWSDHVLFAITKETWLAESNSLNT